MEVLLSALLVIGYYSHSCSLSSSSSYEESLNPNCIFYFHYVIKKGASGCNCSHGSRRLLIIDHIVV